jgi:hypothetical protein
MRPRALSFYVGTVVVAGVLALALLRGTAVHEDPWTPLLLIVLAVVTGARPVRISSLKTSLTATDPLILCALAILGPVAAAAVGLAGAAAAQVGKSRRTRGVKIVFNLGAIALSTAAGAGAFLALGGTPGDAVLTLIWPLAGATAAYFVLNTVLVAGAIALEKRQPVFATWRPTFQWTAVSFFASLSLAVCLALIFERLGAWALALGLPLCWLVLAYFRSHHDRLDEQQRRTREVEALNQELEQTVVELREALDHVKQLQGLLPICMHCNKIRDDENTWHRLESYISQHADVVFSHSLCSDCREIHYPELRRPERKVGAS